MSLYKQLLIGICLFTLTIFCGNFFATLESSREQYHNQLGAHAQDAATALGLSLTAHIDDPVMTGRMPEVRQAVLTGLISPTQAVAELVSLFDIERAAKRHGGLFGIQEQETGEVK